MDNKDKSEQLCEEKEVIEIDLVYLEISDN